MYEQYSRSLNMVFFDYENDELVFDPHYYGILGLLLHTDNLLPYDLLNVCNRCQLCKPDIVDIAGTYSIRRGNYSPFGSDYYQTFVVTETFDPPEDTIPHIQRITFVDDDEIAFTAADILSSHGFVATGVVIHPCARDTKNPIHDIIQKVMETHPDIVISDLSIGDLDGFELIRQLHDKVTTIMMTGTGCRTDEMMEVADGILSRSADMTRIIEVIRSLSHPSTPDQEFLPGGNVS